MLQRWPAIGLATMALALAACGGTTPADRAPAAEKPPAPAASVDVAAPPTLPQEAAANQPGAATSASGPSEAPAAPEAPPTVAVKTDFVATDPSTVQLAAGQPQLVEFYANW